MWRFALDAGPGRWSDGGVRLVRGWPLRSWIGDGGRAMTMGRAVACSAWLLVLVGAPALADQKDAKKLAELKWAKGVATDFLAAMTAGAVEHAERLLSAELKKQVHGFPNWLLDARFDGLGKGYTVTDEQIAPDRDEASFQGLLQGEKREPPYSLRVVRDKDSGLWRVVYFHYGELRDLSAPKK